MPTMLAMLSVALGVVVWPESSLVNVYPATMPGSAREILIEAARGEWESVQLAVRADADIADLVTVEAGGLGDVVPPPSTSLVEYVTLPRGSQRIAALRVPDHLEPYEPFPLSANVTRAVWLTFQIPQDAPAGTYGGEVVVRAGVEEIRVPVSCEVFGFSVPPVESLRSLMPLNRRTLATALGIDPHDLDAWKPVYDALDPFQLSFSIWDDVPSLPRDEAGGLNVPLVQSHLQYAVQQCGMAAIDIGFGAAGLTPVPQPGSQGIIPPEHVYLYDMGHWLRRLGWETRALVITAAPQTRDDWQAAREAAFGVHQAEARMKRIVAAPLHPYLERYVDIWALTLQDLVPVAVDRLRAGESLHSFRPAGAAVVTASGSAEAVGGGAYMTQPGDAFDGSFFSHWTSALAPGEEYAWLQVDLDTQVTTKEIRIGWAAGRAAESVRVRTSFDGRTFSTAAMLWETIPAIEASGLGWSVGRFSASKKFVSIRLEFREQPADMPVAIADLLLAPEVEQDPAPITPVQPWLQTVPGAFPSLALPAHPAEARMLPWVCWAHKTLGFLHRGFAEWPDGWDGLEFPEGWPTDSVLVYPSATGFVPSVRLMRLRDGLEDYEYFRNLEQMRFVFGARGRDIAELRDHPTYAPYPDYRDVVAYGDALLARRAALARAMNDLLRTE